MDSGFFIVSIIPFRTSHKNDQNFCPNLNHGSRCPLTLTGEAEGEEDVESMVIGRGDNLH